MSTHPVIEATKKCQLDLDWREDPETEDGLVTDTGSRWYAKNIAEQLEEEGITASISKGEDGVWYIWAVKRGAA